MTRVEGAADVSIGLEVKVVYVKRCITPLFAFVENVCIKVENVDDVEFENVSIRVNVQVVVTIKNVRNVKNVDNGENIYKVISIVKNVQCAHNIEDAGNSVRQKKSCQNFFFAK